MAVAVITGWLALLIWLIVDAGADEVTWTRLLVVLGSVEAVAFAAAGALFGTTVQRERVTEQRARADEAEARAEGLASDASNGQKLAAAVKASFGDGGEAREPLGYRGRDHPLAVLEMAHRLFPD
ncbi:hypothetical protein [Actinomycetospora corticicola]|uniref:Uncharacterized protein n=1 Tax=Actinomycetospora corticicola TaxID=663602 RepID=A0A7Y9DS93_9PSEU|nr:hypothetical protein [Actinomycetospora corticicola]NYD34565.1 hypothetical protein [Actinomycetospora corticicola]